jgi:benzoate-CoA ligase
VPQGEIGNLLIRSDAVCACYWNQHEKTKNMIEGHWIRTGDKYWQDGDGYYWYAGRADDMLKVNGIWVSPVEIENALISHEAVAECAVIGRNDENGLEKPLAYVVLAAKIQPSAQLDEQLVAHVRAVLPSFKCPRWIQFVEELPKTATGKLQRYKLRKKRTGTLGQFLSNSPLRDSGIEIKPLDLRLKKDAI